MTDPYSDPRSGVLYNKLGIADPEELDRVERQLVQHRIRQGSPSGNFDLPHLRSIHRHLFQDVYEWAGETRTVEISKGGNAFMPSQFIVTGMADVHRRVLGYNHLRGLDPDQFSVRAAEIIGDVNHVHPFREGNGRTQLEYLRQLADRAGHTFRQARLTQAGWIGASKASHMADYKPMAAEIKKALVDRPHEREGDERARMSRLLDEPNLPRPNRDRDHERER